LQENESYGQLRVKLKRYITKNLFEKNAKLQGLNSFENRGQIEVNLKFNGPLRVNLHKFKTKEKALKFSVGIGVWQG